MNNCKDCIYYDNKGTYKGTGYCKLYDSFVNDDESCEDFNDE